MKHSLARLRDFLADRRTALYAWSGTLLIAQAVSVATGEPAVVWPAAVGIGALVTAAANLAIEWAANLPQQAPPTSGYQPRGPVGIAGKPPQGGTGTLKAR